MPHSQPLLWMLLALAFLRNSNALQLLQDEELPCSCPPLAFLGGRCESTGTSWDSVPVTIKSSVSSTTVCAPAPIFDVYTRQLMWSFCYRSECYPGSGGDLTLEMLDAPVRVTTRTHTFTYPSSMNLSWSKASPAELAVGKLSFEGGSPVIVTLGNAVPSVWQMVDMSGAEGAATLDVEWSPGAGSPRSQMLSLVLKDTYMSLGQPSSHPLPPMPPSGSPASWEQLPMDAVTAEVEYVVLAPFLYFTDQIPLSLSDNSTLHVSGYVLYATAGYNDYSILPSCSAAAMLALQETVAEALGDAASGVTQASCRFNSPTSGSNDCAASSVIIVDVAVPMEALEEGASDEEVEAGMLSFRQALVDAMLAGTSSDPPGVGASCVVEAQIDGTGGVVSTRIEVHDYTLYDGNEASSCDSSQDLLLPSLAEALKIPQSALIPGTCQVQVIYPPPEAPAAPDLVRRPYTVWKSAVLGGVLGGVFLLQMVVLAVFIWRGRQQHKKTELALVMAHQGGYDKL